MKMGSTSQEEGDPGWNRGTRWELQASQLGTTMDCVAMGGAEEMPEGGFPTMRGDRRDHWQPPGSLRTAESSAAQKEACHRESR